MGERSGLEGRQLSFAARRLDRARRDRERGFCDQYANSMCSRQAGHGRCAGFKGVPVHNPDILVDSEALNKVQSFYGFFVTLPRSFKVIEMHFYQPILQNFTKKGIGAHQKHHELLTGPCSYRDNCERIKQ